MAMTWSWIKRMICVRMYSLARQITWKYLIFSVAIRYTCERWFIHYRRIDSVFGIETSFSAFFKQTTIFFLNSIYFLTKNSYDSDFNHAPCLKNGHKAHWALIVGCLIDDHDKVSKRTFWLVAFFSSYSVLIDIFWPFSVSRVQSPWENEKSCAMVVGCT